MRKVVRRSVTLSKVNLGQLRMLTAWTEESRSAVVRRAVSEYFAKQMRARGLDAEGTEGVAVG